MSLEPIQRRMTKPNAGTVNVQELMIDDITQLTFIQLNQPNTILDMYNDPDPAATVRYTDELFKNSISTGRNFFTTAMSTASAGRAAIGPIKLSSGQMQMGSVQTSGTAVAANSIVIKFANGF
jgi:hypothetical protein